MIPKLNAHYEFEILFHLVLFILIAVILGIYWKLTHNEESGAINYTFNYALLGFFFLVVWAVVDIIQYYYLKFLKTIVDFCKKIFHFCTCGKFVKDKKLPENDDEKPF